MYKYLTSESVNIGHPDKTCDTIADAFLDEALRQDPDSQMAVECAIKNDKLFIYGEATTKANIDYDGIARSILKDIGYDCKFKIIKEISQQSADIHAAVVQDELKANDQGIIYGYATNETKELMPIPIMIAHAIMREYETERKKHNKLCAGIYYPDAKSQVTIRYDKDGKPYTVDTVVMSVSHSRDLTPEEIENFCKPIIEDVIEKYDYAFKKQMTRKEYDKNIKFLINPSGKFTIWGSFGDSGCVGRKIIVDGYGGAAKVGGGCFSSKNATKVDRSAAYYARYVAKNVVAHKYADRCEIVVAYAIGRSEPIGLDIETFGTEHVEKSKILDYIKSNFDFRPANIIKELDLLKPIYQPTACYGHFGRSEFSWEKIKNEGSDRNAG